MSRRIPERIRIPAVIADEAHHMVDLARGSLSGDPYDPTAIRAYGQIIEAIQQPWRRQVPGDPEIKFGVGLGRHMVADTCLVYAAAQAIAADRHTDMAEALKVLDAAIDDMASGRPVSPWRRGRRHLAGRYRGRHDCGVQAHVRERGGHEFSSSGRRHGSRQTEMGAGDAGAPSRSRHTRT
jgi:hypothetical protein